MFFTSATPGGQKTLSQVTCPRWFCLTQFNLIQHQKNDIEQKIAAKVLCFPKNNPCPVFLPQVFELKNHENFHEIQQKHWPKTILTKKRSHFRWLVVVHRKLQILAPITGLHCWCHRKFMMGKTLLNQPESERIQAENHIISRWILPNMARLFRKPQKTFLWMKILKDVFFVSGRPLIYSLSISGWYPIQNEICSSTIDALLKTNIAMENAVFEVACPTQIASQTC